jgi:uncharacterized membrane-anchored protein
MIVSFFGRALVAVAIMALVAATVIVVGIADLLTFWRAGLVRRWFEFLGALMADSQGGSVHNRPSMPPSVALCGDMPGGRPAAPRYDLIHRAG